MTVSRILILTLILTLALILTFTMTMIGRDLDHNNIDLTNDLNIKFSMASSRILIFLTLTLNLIFTPNLVLDSVSGEMENSFREKLSIYSKIILSPKVSYFFAFLVQKTKCENVFFFSRNFAFFLRNFAFLTFTWTLTLSMSLPHHCMDSQTVVNSEHNDQTVDV